MLTQDKDSKESVSKGNKNGNLSMKVANHSFKHLAENFQKQIMQNKKQSTGSSRKENSYINVVSEENIPAFVFNNPQQPA